MMLPSPPVLREKANEALMGSSLGSVDFVVLALPLAGRVLF